MGTPRGLAPIARRQPADLRRRRQEALASELQGSLIRRLLGNRSLTLTAPPGAVTVRECPWAWPAHPKLMKTRWSGLVKSITWAASSTEWFPARAQHNTVGDPGTHPRLRNGVGRLSEKHRILRCVPLRVRDVIKALEQAGWRHVRTTGDRRVFRGPGGRITVVSGRLGDDVRLGTHRAILRQTGIKDQTQ